MNAVKLNMAYATIAKMESELAALREQLTQHAIAIRDMNVTEAALREELAESNECYRSLVLRSDVAATVLNEQEAELKDVQQRLAAAEQRNAEAEDLLRRTLAAIEGEGWNQPKHYRRGKGYYIGYGIMSRELHAIKDALDYKSYLINEIEDIKHRGGKHVAKLRKYLKRAA